MSATLDVLLVTPLRGSSVLCASAVLGPTQRKAHERVLCARSIIGQIAAVAAASTSDGALVDDDSAHGASGASGGTGPSQLEQRVDNFDMRWASCWCCCVRPRRKWARRFGRSSPWNAYQATFVYQPKGAAKNNERSTLSGRGGCRERPAEQCPPSCCT